MLKNRGPILILAGCLLLALILRFLYFPNNIYFGYDQARDAFVVQDLLHGKLRLIGPSTLIAGLFHGPLYYYLFAPLYLFSGGNPEWVSAFLRVINSLGVFTVFFIATILFNRKAGFLAAFFYAVSFEQTQFAIYLNHPSLSIQAVLIFYLGLIIFLFKKKWWGLMMALIGLGLSIQFEFPLIYLSISLVILLLLFRKKFPQMSFKQILFSATGLGVAVLTFILAEIKYHFRGVTTLIHGILFPSSAEGNIDILHNIFLIASRYIQDSLFAGAPIMLALILLFIAIFFIWKRWQKEQILFLLVWFGVGLVPYLKNTASIPLYYYSGGASIAAIVFASFLISKLFSVNKIVVIFLIGVIIISNLYQIQKFNPFGTLPSINVQSGMLWSDQKKVVDYIYQNGQEGEIAVNALSVPLNVNMVWSYVFEQYGQKKYGYLPVWGRDAAEGYAGHLKIEKARSILPEKQFLIIEPTIGIEQYMVNDFMNQENLFTKKIDEKSFGLIKVQTRQKI